MSNKRHLVRAAVYVVLEKDGQILLLRRHNTGYRDGQYSLPAGHVEPNETFFETCVRESKEEVGVDVKEKDLELIQVMQRREKGVDVVDYYFRAKEWRGIPIIGEPHKADDLKWVSPKEIKYHAIYFVSKSLENSLNNVMYSHDGLSDQGL